jgi:predicted dehydrogenase
MSFTPDALNVVFLGCGAVAAAHSRTVRRHFPQIRCFYASRDRTRSAEYERRFRGAGSYPSYEAALADGLMDAVVIATPPATHFHLALQALQHDKDVIVEKPAALSASECALLAESAAATGRRVLVAENYRYKPLTRTLRAVLDSGAIGDVRLVQLNVLKRQETDGWRAGCGALLEGGVHWLHLLASLGPDIHDVRGFPVGSARSPERGMVVVGSYANGGVGVLAHSWETRSVLRGLGLSRIYGTEGSIAFESNGLVTVVRARRRWLFRCAGRDIGGYRAMFADFFSALRGGAETEMTLEQARRDLELVERAYASAALGPR